MRTRTTTILIGFDDFAGHRDRVLREPSLRGRRQSYCTGFVALGPSGRHRRLDGASAGNDTGRDGRSVSPSLNLTDETCAVVFRRSVGPYRARRSIGRSSTFAADRSNSSGCLAGIVVLTDAYHCLHSVASRGKLWPVMSRKA